MQKISTMRTGETSMVTSKPAMCGHFKTGHRQAPRTLDVVPVGRFSCKSHF